MLFLVFNYFDVDNDGYLTSVDLSAALQRLGLAPASTQEALKEAEDLVEYVEHVGEDRCGGSVEVDLALGIHI